MFVTASRRVFSFLLFFSAILLLAGPAAAQARFNADSASRARHEALEAMRALQKHRLDSAREARQQIIDSMKAVRKHRSDSLSAIRKYRESRRYKDSVQDVREERLAALREERQARLDSMRDARQRITDSIRDEREARMAIIRSAQKRRADSFAAIRNYRSSKRFKDSVAIVRKARADSLHEVRKAFTDSLTAMRKAHMDSLRAERKAITDSLTAVRKARTDSLAAIRKEREAAMAKRKEHSERDKKVKEKQAEQKAQLAFELKIKQKRSVYSNENMLKKKWSAPRRAFQNTFTHYNYYFNANRKMEEAEANMERTARDNWDERIPLFSFNPLKDSSVFASDMDSVIQKTSLGIQIHDPRTKWADDLYLLLGKAYYYKGDFENASASFKYIVALQERAKAAAAKKAAYSNKSVYGKRKQSTSIVAPEQKGISDVLKRDAATNDGLLWLARTFTTYGHYGEAEAILDLVANDQNFPSSLRGELALEKAYLELKQHNDKAAASDLAIVSADRSIETFTRRRAAYLAGQLLEEQGAYQDAAAQYQVVSDLHPQIDMDFYARRNRAYALMESGGVQQDAIGSLKSMLNDGKFSPYYEQVYYVLGRLSANAGKNDDAIRYLQQGVASAKTTRKQKALSFAALGNLYFASGQYQQAKAAYDSVARFASAATGDSNVVIAMRRAPLVDKVALPAYVMHQQDSLLALAGMSEKEQRAVARRFLRLLEKQREDSAFQAENPNLNAAATATGSTGSAGSWYFSSPAALQQGYAEFKRKWGSRPLTDNWRRAAVMGAPGTIASNPNAPDAGAGNQTANAASAATDENGLPTEEAVMSYIPRTPEARAVAVGRLQRSYADLATAYIRQFEDYPRAAGVLDSFDKRWSLNPYTAEATYLRYLIALRQNRLSDAQTVAARLRKDFAGTQWADFVSGPDNGSAAQSQTALASVGDFYDETYDLLQQRQYGEVLSRTRTARNRFSDETYSNRFRIVEAMAFAGSAQYKEADTILKDFIRTHQKDALRPWAEQVLSYVTAQKKTDTSLLVPDSTIQTAPRPAGTTPTTSLPLGQPPIDSSTLPPPAEYAYTPTEAHYFIFAVDVMEARAMGVKAGLGDLNTFRYSSDNLDVSLVPLKGGQAMIVVRPFKNIIAARKYLNDVKAAKPLVREYKPDEYEMLIISASNYRKLLHDASLKSYLPFYRARY
jgi:tetratricopeptide (TPR) repeat protein